MAYASLQDLTTYGIASAALTGFDPSNAIQNAALNAASAEADGALTDRYTLPLKSWGADLTAAVAKIAAFECLRIRGFSPEGIDQPIRDGAKDARAWLRLVAEGKLAVSAVVDSSPNQSAGGYGGPFVLQPQRAPTPGIDGIAGLVPGTPSDRGF